MATFPSVAAAIDKSKLASEVAHLALLEIDVIDPASGTLVETLYLVHNDEDFVHQGQTYIPLPFEFDVTWNKGELAEITLRVTDFQQVIQGRLQAYQGAVDFPVRLKIVTSAAPNNVEIEERFQVVESRAAAESYEVEFSLGAENPLALRWPTRMMFRNRCFWKYKGVECGYAGPLGTCDFSLDGANGCKAHGNQDRFGGFRGIRRYSYR